MTDELEGLIDEVRLTFHSCSKFARRLHGDHIDPPGRAVLEYLSVNGPTAVPELARSRGVTRQHIQTIVHGLEERELVRPEPNPAHARSPLFVLTATGTEMIENVTGEERRVLGPAFDGFDRDRLTSASETLADVRALLTSLEN